MISHGIMILDSHQFSFKSDLSARHLLYLGYLLLNTKKISCFCTDGKISVRINLPLFSSVVPAIIIAGTTVENKGKLILFVTCFFFTI